MELMKGVFLAPKDPPVPPTGGPGDPNEKAIVINHPRHGKIKVPVMAHYKGKTSKNKPVPGKFKYKLVEMAQDDGSVFLAAYDVRRSR